MCRTMCGQGLPADDDGLVGVLQSGAEVDAVWRWLLIEFGRNCGLFLLCCEDRPQDQDRALLM